MTSLSDDLLPWKLHTCECCLASSQNIFKDISTEYFCMGQKEVYAEMIFNAFCITINAGDGDHKICDICIQKLREATNFKQQVIESQKTLLKRIHEISVEEIKNDIKMEDDSLDVSSSINDISDIEDNLDELSTPDVKTMELEIEITKINEQRPQQRKEAPCSSAQTPGGDLARKSRDKWMRERHLKINTVKLIRNSNLCPFKWHRNKYQCFCCKDTFTSFSTLKEHTSKHSWIDLKNIVTRHNSVLFHKVEVSSLKCKICTQPQDNLQSLRDHLKSKHYLLFEKEGDLLIPFILENGYKCAVCQETFEVFYKLNIHMNMHFQNFICETCGAGFTNQSNLREHSLRHSTKHNVCDICKIEFTNAYQKTQHDSNVHKKSAKRACPYCGEKFNNHYSRLMHTISVHGEKKPEFKCSSCDRVFFRKYLLNAHVRKFHMREKPHECNICSFKFFNKSDLTNHMVTHTGVKNFVCSYCGKSYSRKGSLTCHLRSHSDNPVKASLE